MGIDATTSISVNQAMNLYGVTKEDLKTLNSNGDDKITLKELQNWGINKNAGLREYFNGKTSGELLAVNQKGKPNFTGVKNVTNPYGNLKNAFVTNYNKGELSPQVSSTPFGKTAFGNRLDCYA
jgi:hypothetical protein